MPDDHDALPLQTFITVWELYPASSTFDGLVGTEFNLDKNGKPVSTCSTLGSDKDTLSIPDPDPGELWTDINTQLFEVADPTTAQIPSMGGL